jgi:hypothetical protein
MIDPEVLDYVIYENEEILSIKAELSLLKGRMMFERWRKLRYC